MSRFGWKPGNSILNLPNFQINEFPRDLFAIGLSRNPTNPSPVAFKSKQTGVAEAGDLRQEIYITCSNTLIV